jgi:hypothetical protein
MPSSVVAAIDYNFETATLRIVYQTGTVYDYEGVEPVIYEGMKAARSKGTFLNRYILGRYEYKKVK